MNQKKIGIFGGSFDPVHRGHIAFALQAIKEARLDYVYFLPEIKPRLKPGVTHISHRIAMLNLATAPFPKLRVLEINDKNFLPRTTFPRLQQKFKDAEISLLMGTEVADNLVKWPLVQNMLESVSLIIASRTKEPTFSLPAQPLRLYLLKSEEPNVSSSVVRHDIRQAKKAPGVLNSVYKYAKDNWLYSDVSATGS